MSLPKTEKAVVIENGNHTAKLVDIEQKDTKGFDYTYINFDIEGAKVSLSAPTQISFDEKSGNPTTKLGKYLVALGLKLEVGKTPDESGIIGNEYKVMTATQDVKDKGKFARIVSINGNAI